MMGSTAASSCLPHDANAVRHLEQVDQHHPRQVGEIGDFFGARLVGFMRAFISEEPDMACPVCNVRRDFVLSRQAVDHLGEGRLALGVGIRKTAQMLDAAFYRLAVEHRRAVMGLADPGHLSLGKGPLNIRRQIKRNVRLRNLRPHVNNVAELRYLFFRMEKAIKGLPVPQLSGARKADHDANPKDTSSAKSDHRKKLSPAGVRELHISRARYVERHAFGHAMRAFQPDGSHV